MPGNMKEFHTSPESDVLIEVTKEIKFDCKKTNELPEGNGKSKVLKAEMKETASFSGKCKSINTVLEAKHDEKKKKVNYHIIVHKN